MDLLTLKYFIVTAQTQHITRAARQLNITQPALSATLKRLESTLGCQLFDRNGRGIQLNRNGEILLEHALRIDRIMDECLEELKAEQGKNGRFVRLACSSAPTNTQLISHLLAQDIRVDACLLPRTWSNELSDGSLDLVLTFGVSSFRNLDRCLLCNYRIVVVAGKGHPLAGKESVTIDDLNASEFCCNSAPHSLTYMAKSTLASTGFSPNITFQGRDVSDMLRLIRKNSHLGLMVKDHLPDDADIRILPVTGFDPIQPFYMYWNRNRSNPLLPFIRRTVQDFFDQQPL